MTRSLAAGLLLLIVPMVRADEAPTRGRVLTATFGPDTVVPLVGQVGNAVDVCLAEGERVINVAAGDLGALDLGIVGNHVVVRPRHVLQPTSLIVFTDRHTYYFDYRAETTSADPPVLALHFTYERPPGPAPVVSAAPVFHADYWYCGATDLEPVAAYDDGERTYLRFPRGRQLPVIYRDDLANGEALTNFHVEGDWVVVHEVAPRWALRRGTTHGCVQRRP